MQNLTETTVMKYRVVLNGMILTEAVSSYMAERYLEGLSEEARSKAEIIPVTADGKQVLMG